MLFVVQDLQKCRDVLLGNSSAQSSDLNLLCPGMFQERKQTNFFQVLKFLFTLCNYTIVALVVIRIIFKLFHNSSFWHLAYRIYRIYMD